MRKSEAGLALIRRAGAGGAAEYLTQWSDKWRRFSLVGGHVEPGESFRECCEREVSEELQLTPGEHFRVAAEPVAPPARYTAVSGAAGVETAYHMHLFAVDLLPGADAAVAADPTNRWLSRAEIDALSTAAGEPVAEQVRTVFGLCGVR